ncbi:GPR endopeptidase [Bacillus horti]|uniref:Germination protease n=1 Tax=Caldalkalibacillus horti TaxID=77523 RepID=A0ABT9VSZ9_9BACI|nr:GPR endopeptidase [Bacillus horti]MDQ0164113.1 spore protease [Bacillus horti]
MEENKEKEIDLSKYQVRTDLAVEAHQIAEEEEGQGIPGVRLEELEQDHIYVTKVYVDTEEGAKKIGKNVGKYLTIEAQPLRKKDTEFQNKVTTLFAQQFHAFLEEVGIKPDDSVLIIGLGNWNVTPDALGPIVVENIMVTSHLFELAPENVEEGFRRVSALSPGVLGITGIETSQVVEGVISQIQPDFVIAIDALASSSLERVNTTIQISDTGISPGSGIGNKRKALSKEVLGVPVIAIGVPTVVDAVSIVSNSIDFVLGHMGKEMKDQQENTNARRALAPGGMGFNLGQPKRFNPDHIPAEEERRTLLGLVGTLEEHEKRRLIHEVLQPLGHQLIVTPKEIDTFIEDIGNIVANGLNAALHEKIDMSNVSAYTH